MLYQFTVGEIYKSYVGSGQVGKWAENLEESKRKGERNIMTKVGTTGNELDPEGIDHPAHYNVHPSGVECIEVVRHMTFNIGNVIKYLWRDGIKGTDVPLQDLKKAAWYLNDEIIRRENDVETPSQEYKIVVNDV